ncbi:FACT complex subunit ssrp1, partial [Cladochytrium tenue]
DVIKTKYGGRLFKAYDGPTYVVVSDVFSALTNRTTNVAGAGFRSAQGHSGIKCALKANEAFLYPLDKCFLSIPKPTTLIPYTDVSVITFQRVSSGSSTATKTFEIHITTTAGVFAYSSIPREEYAPLEEFFRSKKLKVTTEGDGLGQYQASDEEEGGEGEDGAAGGKRKRQEVGYQEEDGSDESEDEDFVGGDSSDGDLEFDSDARSSGSEAEGSDDDAGSASGGSGDEGDDAPKRSKRDDASPPAKKRASDDAKPSKKAAGADSKRNGSGKGADASPPAAKKARGGDGKAGARKDKKDKDPNAPKRPTTAYIYFTKDVRESIKAEDPAISATDILKEAGVRWKAMSDADKKKYEELAAEDSARYKREVAEYDRTRRSGPSAASKPAASKPAAAAGSSSKKAEAARSAEYVDDDDDGGDAGDD